MRLAVAQTRPVAGDVVLNLERHGEFVSRAARAAATLILFPELSLTGYEPTLARDFALTPKDSRLDIFQEMSDAHGMIIGVGVPLVAEPLPQIGLVLFQPAQERLIYAKRYLHEDELPYFVPGTRQVTITHEGQILAPAICYESLLSEHAEQAAVANAHVYLASVAKPEGGVRKAYEHYPVIAREHRMNVVMANSLGPSDTFVCAGESGAWTSDGSLVGKLDSHREGLLLFDSDMQTCETYYL